MRHFYYFLRLALFMRWRSPRCQNMPFIFLRLDGGLFKLSFSQFSRCLLSLNNNSSAIADSMNRKWFHHEWFYLSVTRLTASTFSVHHKHFSLPLQLETDFHNSGRVRTKKKKTLQLLLFLDAAMHLHFKKSGYPQRFELTWITRNITILPMAMSILYQSMWSTVTWHLEVRWKTI